MESLNFVHDVNVMRKVMKTTYANSVDLRALNGELGDGFKNCRVQVLPVCWRHLLDFPKKREKKGERDLADASNEEDECTSDFGFLDPPLRVLMTGRPLARRYHNRGCGLCAIPHF